MVVRWLGAFGTSGDGLAAAFDWEFTQSEREVAAERVTRERPSRIRHALVGLRVRSTGVIRVFPGDVWSVPAEDGTLIKTRRGVNTHTEVFCRPGHFDAIVVKCPMARLVPHVRDAVLAASEKFNVPVIVLK